MQNNVNETSNLKVLVLGGDGMLGHQLVRTLSPYFEVKATLRSQAAVPEARNLFTGGNAVFGVDVQSRQPLKDVIRRFLPHVVINAIGIVKQRHEAIEAVPCISINALFPHRLQQMVESIGARIIHISTDCVFSGRKGCYAEKDVADANDLYGRSKLLGELTSGNALTLRTSMIGRELKRKKSLLEWFLNQKGRIPGYIEAIFSGLTTLELSRLIGRLIVDHPEAKGLYHVSGPTISKYDLLCLVRDTLHLDIEIVPDRTVKIDRSLDAKVFQDTFNYTPPTWESMIEELTLSTDDPYGWVHT